MGLDIIISKSGLFFLNEQIVKKQLQISRENIRYFRLKLSLGLSTSMRPRLKKDFFNRDN